MLRNCLKWSGLRRETRCSATSLALLIILLVGDSFAPISKAATIGIVRAIAPDRCFPKLASRLGRMDDRYNDLARRWPNTELTERYASLCLWRA